MIRDEQAILGGAFVDLPSQPSQLVGEDSPTVKSGMRTVASPVDFNGGGSAVRGVTPSAGQHTREVLRELGYDDGKIEAMIQAAVAMD